MGTGSERWQRIEQIYRQALERESEARAALLDDACGADAALRHEVESLLACEPASATFIEAPALEMVADMLSHADLVGRNIGSYAVTAWLGSGGMGDVYRARDARLGRDVAIKVLPSAFVSDRDRVARFTREAQVLASLNHPNIAAIYRFEEANDVKALVLELVEGPTLAECIAKGPIPVDDALPMARQIADALEAAHEQGIIHRDLKPANIKLRPDGAVKVLDFGLAKALERVAAPRGEATTSPTITGPERTQMGMILGTAAYMSPEQAKGRQADKRSDVWAFGAVLYEMMSGRRAFTGEDISDTLAAVLRQDVDWTALPASTPVSVRRLLARCLDRDVRQRLRDIGEARIVLADPAPHTIGDAKGGASVSPLVTRFRFVLGEGQQFTNPGRLVAISPDGTRMVYSANQRLYLRSMSELEAKPIPGTEVPQGFVAEPVFSPDSRSVAFISFSRRTLTLKRIAVGGGAAVAICPLSVPFGLTWAADGILFGQGTNGIMRVSANGGKSELIVSVTRGELAHDPQMLPDGQTVLFTLAADAGTVVWDEAKVVVQRLRSGERKVLIDGGSDARYLPTGHIVYALDGVLFAVPFDLKRLEVTGGPIPMIEGIRRSLDTGGGTAHFSVSETGSLVYVPGPVSTTRTDSDLALIDRNGIVQQLRLPAGSYHVPRVSPDGKRVAVGTVEGKEAIVWLADLAGTSSIRRLTFTGKNRFPIWSADGQRVAFQSDREGDLGIFWQSADGIGPAERLTKPEEGTAHVPESWSPNGDVFLFGVTEGSKVSLWTFSVRDREAKPFGVRSSAPIASAFSRDGQ